MNQLICSFKYTWFFRLTNRGSGWSCGLHAGFTSQQPRFDSRPGQTTKKYHRKWKSQPPKSKCAFNERRPSSHRSVNITEKCHFTIGTHKTWGLESFSKSKFTHTSLPNQVCQLRTTIYELRTNNKLFELQEFVSSFLTLRGGNMPCRVWKGETCFGGVGWVRLGQQ